MTTSLHSNQTLRIFKLPGRSGLWCGPATIWRGAAFHFLAIFSKMKVLWKLWLWFSKMFHQRVLSDRKWSISKFQFWQRILDIYGKPLLRSDDGRATTRTSKKAIGLITKTILHAHHAFLYISLPSLHDYDVKMPIFTFYSDSTQATKFPLSFWTWIWFLGIQVLGGFTYIWQS